MSDFSCGYWLGLVVANVVWIIVTYRMRATAKPSDDTVDLK